MKKALFSLFTVLLLAIPAYAQSRDKELKPGDVFIAKEFRHENRNGNCVWAATEANMMTAGYEPSRGLFERAVKEGWGGAGMSRVLSFAKDAKIDMVSQKKGDHRILFDSVRHGTGAYIEIPGHAIVLVGIDKDFVRLLDNNLQAGNTFMKVWTRERFDKEWEGNACYPKINRNAKPEWVRKSDKNSYRLILDDADYAYLGNDLIGRWDEKAQTWHAWKDGKYVLETAPWESKEDNVRGRWGIFPLRRPRPYCPGPYCPSPTPSDHPSPNPLQPMTPTTPVPTPDLPAPPKVDPGLKPLHPFNNTQELKKQLDEIQSTLKNMKPAKDGIDGLPGKNGLPGLNGADGKNGKDAAGVDVAALIARIDALEATVRNLRGAPAAQIQVLPEGVAPKAAPK